MGILIGCIYAVLAIIMFFVSLKLHARDKYVDKDDFYMHLVLFGVLWFIGLVLIIGDIVLSFADKIVDRILNWANK